MVAQVEAATTLTQGAAASRRVTSPVEGLFDGIQHRLRVPFHDPVAGTVEGTISDKIRQGGGGREIIKTTITLPDGRNGLIERAYDPKTKTFEMLNAFLEDVPSWVSEPGLPSMGPKGVPTVTFLTLRQMKILEVPYGQLSRVKMSTIQNVRGILELNVVIANGADPNEAILQTHSVQYASTAIQQSGHRVVSASVEFRKKDRSQSCSITASMTPGQEEKTPAVVEKHDKLIADYGAGVVGRDTEVEWNYDIYLNLAPFGGEP